MQKVIAINQLKLNTEFPLNGDMSLPKLTINLHYKIILFFQ